MNMRWLVNSVIFFSGCMAAQLIMAGGADPDQILIRSEQYVIDVRGCAFTDGYQCTDPAEDDFLSAASQDKMISGNLLRAWKVAYENFTSQVDQTSEQKQLKHYKIGFTESPEHYIILFQSLLMPRVEGGKVSGMTSITYGRTTKFWVNRQSFEIEKKLFYK